MISLGEYPALSAMFFFGPYPTLAKFVMPFHCCKNSPACRSFHRNPFDVHSGGNIEEMPCLHAARHFARVPVAVGIAIDEIHIQGFVAGQSTEFPSAWVHAAIQGTRCVVGIDTPSVSLRFGETSATCVRMSMNMGFILRLKTHSQPDLCLSLCPFHPPLPAQEAWTVARLPRGERSRGCALWGRRRRCS